MSEPASPSPVAEGEVLAGKYRVERILGRGGMGVVVAATHVALRQKVAIKFLLPEASGEIVTRFLREARAAVRLKSDHVARVIDVGELPNGAPFMVMEYLEGNDLSQVLKKKGGLPVADAVDYVLQACEAIAEAHVAGIVHRDLKPANLFLTTAADGTATVKVLDFGISKDTGGGGESGDGGDEELALTRTTAVLGSPHFMAPEQMRSTRSVDARADIWSLGAVLYQLTTKSVPYKAPSFMDLVLKVMKEDAPPPSSLRPDLPPEFDAVVMGCLQRDRDRRFATIADLARALAPMGRSGARRSAERIARMQGAAPSSMDRPSFSGVLPVPSTSTPSTPPVSMTDPPMSLPRMNPGETPNPPISVPPPSAQSSGSLGQPAAHGKTAESPGRTANTWAREGGKSGETPSGPPRKALFALGALMAVAVGGLAALKWFGPRGEGRSSAEPTTAPASTASIVAEDPPPRSTAAETTERPSPSASANAPPVDTKPDAPPNHDRAAAHPREPASSAPSAVATAKPSVTFSPIKPPALKPAASAPKRNPLDMEIQ